MARVAKLGLSHHPTKGFRISIGRYEKDGRTRPKVFWLGHDPLLAMYAADQYRGTWTGLQVQGESLWTADAMESVRHAVQFYDKARRAVFERQCQDEERVLDERGKLEELFGPPPGAGGKRPPKSPPETEECATLYKSMKVFLESFDGKRKSPRHKQRMRQVLNVNLKHIRADVPLDQIDFIWLDKLCDHFKNRPPNQKDRKTPLAAASVKGILTYLRLFFTWLDDVSYGGWEMPRKAAKCFRVRLDELLTPAEIHDAATIEQFDVATLKTLYAAADDRQRSIILTSLFTGATQHELSVMKKREFKLDESILTHVRHKTRVTGRYWLPPELVKLLRTQFDARPTDELVWRTHEGNPLVTYQQNGQSSDSVRQFWDDLRDKAKLPDALSFKYLRKFLADYCARYGGEEIGAIAMSHSRRTILARNYSTARPFEQFHKIQKKMHRELSKAGMFRKTTATSKTARDAVAA